MNTHRPIDISYQDTQNLIYSTVHNFQKKRGGNFDDLLSIAHEAFMDAWERHNEEKSLFSTWLRNNVYWSMFRSMHSTQKEKENRVELNLLKLACKKHFSMELFLDELSVDARLVITIALHAPRELTETDPQETKTLIKELLQEVGWSLERITESFEEIWEVLKS